MKSFEGSFRHLNFLPSTSILLNFFFPFIDITFFWSSIKLQYTRTIVLLFQKRRWSMRFPGHQEKRRLPKSTARFPAKKRWHSLPPPPRLGLSWDSPPPPAESTDGRTDVRSCDYYVTTKISRIHRLPNLLSNGALLVGFARRLHYHFEALSLRVFQSRLFALLKWRHLVVRPHSLCEAKNHAAPRS